jgi:hypothetical protein
MVHNPLPGPAALAESVNVDVLQSSWSAPAAATGGVALLVRVTSSKLAHEPFVIVHLNVTLFPAVRPVTVLTSDEGVVTVAPFAAPMMLHDPVPVTGAFPISEKSPKLH